MNFYFIVFFAGTIFAQTTNGTFNVTNGTNVTQTGKNIFIQFFYAKKN